MKVAISSNSDDLEAQVDLRFGRTQGFIIYDTDDGTHTYVDNVQNLQAVQGAGIQSAQNVVNADAQAVITGHCGPKAFNVLNNYDIKIYTVENLKVSEAIEKLKNGELSAIETADVSGHWM